MKKYVVLFAIFIGPAVAACGQTSVPAAVKTSFGKEFKVATTKWAKEFDNYEPDFKQIGQDMSALFKS